MSIAIWGWGPPKKEPPTTLRNPCNLCQPDRHGNNDATSVSPAAEAPRITPARGPPLWDDAGAQETGEGVEAEPDWIWQTHHRQTTPTISALLGYFAMGRDDCAGVELRYWASRHPAGAQWGKNSWRVSLPPAGKHVF